MSHKAAFRQSDVTRALKGAQAAGMDVNRVEIAPDGRIVIMSTNGPAPDQPSELDCWMADNARKA